MMMEDVIKRLLDSYDELAAGQALEYSFGYFDAVAVLRQIAEEEKMK